MTDDFDTGYERLESQITWYDQKSTSNQRWFKRIKLAEIISASIIPFAAPYVAAIAATLGVIVVVLEGTQHLYQFQQNWIAYRSTCEALTHEKYLFLAKVGAYEDMETELARKLLARRVEALVSTEHSRWLIVREKTDKKTAKPRARALTQE